MCQSIPLSAMGVACRLLTSFKGYFVLATVHKQLGQVLSGIPIHIGWLFKVFGIRFCMGCALAGLVLMAGWMLPQSDADTAVARDTDTVIQFSSVTPKASLSAALPPTQRDDHHRLSYLEFDPAVSHRLNHSGMTQSVLTGSHLTRAHFFTGKASPVSQ